MKKSLQKLCSIALVLTTATAGAGAIATGLENKVESYTYADAVEVTENVLKVMNYTKSVALGESFAMPTLKFATGATITAKVIAPNGKVVKNLTYNEESGTYNVPASENFNLDIPGRYTINFIVELGSEKFTTSVNVFAEMENATLTLKNSNRAVENLADVTTVRYLPSKISEDYTGDLYIPEYELKNDEGNSVTATVEVKVTKESNTYNVDSSTGKIDFNGDALEKGTYTVTYVAKNNNAFVDSKTITFEVVDADEFKDAKLTTNWNNKVDAVKVGTEQKLPTISATYGNVDVNVVYSVKVEAMVDGTLTDVSNVEANPITGAKVLSINEDGQYVLTPHLKDTYYHIVYSVKDAFGHTANPEFNINTVNVPSTVTPIVVSKAYNDNALLPQEDENYKLPTFIDLSETHDIVRILPISAKDVACFKLEDFESLTREIRVSGSTKSLWTDTFNKDENGTVSTTANKVAVYNLGTDEYTLQDGETLIALDGDNKLKSGTKYQVIYKAVDKYGVTNSESYYFTLAETVADIEVDVDFFEATPESVDAGEKIVISGISASAKNSKDERVRKAVAYRLGNTGNWTVLDAKDGKYTIPTETAGLMNVLAVAIDDQCTAEYSTVAQIEELLSDKTIAEIQGLTGVTVKEAQIEVKSTTLVADTLAPQFIEISSFTGLNAGVNYKVGEEITLPTVTVADDNIANVSVDVVVRKLDASGNKAKDYEVTNCLCQVGTNYILSGGKFQVPAQGKYMLIYSATDRNGNVASKFYTFEVDAQIVVENPKFEKLIASDTTIKLGESYTLPVATVNNAGAGVYNSESGYKVEIVGGPTGAILNSKTFTPSKPGIYVIKYSLDFTPEYISAKTTELGGETAFNEYKEDLSRTFTITVEDKTAPKLKVDTSSMLDYYTATQTVEIPVAYILDEDIDMEKSTVKVTATKALVNPLSLTWTEMLEENVKRLNSEASKLSLKLENNRVYTITWYVVDVNGNSNTLTKSFTVGDVIKPELTIPELEKLVTGNLPTKAGQGLIIDLNDALTDGLITISDAGTEDFGANPVKVKLTLNGSEITPESSGAGYYQFENLGAGDYTVTFSVTDDANNTREVTKTFTIKSEETNSKSFTEVMGTVLIVISVVVLAGVIVYFIITKRKTDKIINR